MIVDLSHIDQEPLAFREELELGEERLGAGQIVPPMRVLLEGVVRRLASGFVIDGRFKAVGQVTCARCLEPVPWSAEEPVFLELLPASSAPQDDEVDLAEVDLGVSFLERDVIDLTDVAAEQVSLALPMRILCSASCAGLCPQCGANRNVDGECQCEPQVDPRWESLRSAWNQSS